jgi:hypothetical protein
MCLFERSSFQLEKEECRFSFLQCENESLITAAVKFGTVGFVDIFTSIYNL